MIRHLHIDPSSTSAAAPAVDTRGLTKRFGSLVALRDCTLRIPEGT